MMNRSVLQGSENGPAYFLCADRAPALPPTLKRNDLVAKGQYIFAVAGGCACHTEPKKEAERRRAPLPDPVRQGL